MKSEILENGYYVIPKFVTRKEAARLAKEFQQYAFATNAEGDIQTPKSHAAYNFIDFLELLCEKNSEVSKIVGEKVLPTYTYARVYKNGADLKIHQDRDECEVSMTLHLDGDKQWPIFFEKPSGEVVSIILNPGDAVLYMGCDIRHWREVYDGEQYTQVFLHYVLSRGKRAHAVFDNSNPTDKITMMPEQATTPQTMIVSDVTTTNIDVMKHTTLNDFILVLDSFVPHDVCDEILAEYTKSSEWVQTTVSSEAQVRKDIRNADVIGISFDSVINANYDVRKYIDQRLFECAGEAIRTYATKFPSCNIEMDTGYELLRYQEGGFYRMHTDNFSKNPREVSCSFALNDDYEGGEFAFFGGQVKHKLKKGSAIMFPSNFMFPHEILPVTKGTRYSIITWFI